MLFVKLLVQCTVDDRIPFNPVHHTCLWDTRTQMYVYTFKDIKHVAKIYNINTDPETRP